MKKIVILSLLALCLPWTLVAQSADDDLYYIPSKKKENAKVEKKEPTAPARVVIETKAPTTVYTVPEATATTTVIVKDRKGNKRSVDEYNRRYTARENDFSLENDTLYIEEKAQPDLEGEWVNGEFQGSEDDYEYATRIIRFRNPRYAISISSPLYWDVVYGLNSWDWNVYTDGLYAYAFPTYTNRLWWDWRYNYYGWGWPSYYGWGIVGIRPIGDSVGVAGMVATMPAGGDTIITTITTTTGVGIRPAAIGVEMPIGEMPIPPVVLWEHPSVPIQVLAHLVRRPDVRRSSMGGSRCVARLLRQDRCAEVRLLQAMQLVG